MSSAADATDTADTVTATGMTGLERPSTRRSRGRSKNRSGSRSGNAAGRSARKPAATATRRPATGSARGAAKARTGRRRSAGGRMARLLLVAVAAVVTVAFGLLLFRLTLTPSPASSPYVTDNTQPGETLRLYLDRPSVRAAVRQIGGNFVLLMPLGALLPVVVRRLAGPVRIALVTFVLSLAIETAQGTVVTGRSFDADDVILNTVGAVFAYLVLGRRLARWSSRRS